MTARQEKFEITGTSSAADTDGYANDVNTTDGLPFTLAATVPGDSLAHKVIITPSGSVTGDYIITGTGPNGQSQTETLATDTTNAVTSAKYYKSVTEVLAPAGIGANTVDIGWTAASVTAWQSLSPQMTRLNFGVTKGTGSPTYTVQQTFDGDAVFDHADVAAETTSQWGTIVGPVAGIRLVWTAAGQATLTGLQSFS